MSKRGEQAAGLARVAAAECDEKQAGHGAEPGVNGRVAA